MSDYWTWLPGTPVVILSGVGKDRKAYISEYVPFRTSFKVVFGPNENPLIVEAANLKRVVDEKPVEESPAEEDPKEAIITETSESDVKISTAATVLESPENNTVEAHKEEQKLTQATLPKKNSSNSETPVETLLRLSQRSTGVTLLELSKERKSPVKGPFKRTMAASAKRGEIKKGGWKRKGEDVYISSFMKVDDIDNTEEVEEIEEPDSSSLKEDASQADLNHPHEIPSQDPLEIIGKFLICAGEFLIKINEMCKK